jgi:hypothetical protein
MTRPGLPYRWYDSKRIFQFSNGSRDDDQFFVIIIVVRDIFLIVIIFVAVWDMILIVLLIVLKNIIIVIIEGFIGFIGFIVINNWILIVLGLLVALFIRGMSQIVIIHSCNEIIIIIVVTVRGVFIIV